MQFKNNSVTGLFRKGNLSKFKLYIFSVVFYAVICLPIKAEIANADICLMKYSDISSQISNCENILENLNKNNQSLNIHEDLTNTRLKLIELYTKQGDFFKARRLISTLDAEAQSQFSFLQKFNFLRRKGILFYRQGELPKALNAFNQAVELAQAQNISEQLAKALSDVGTAHLAMMQYPEALQAYQQSLKLKEVEASPDSIAVTLNNLGTVYRKMADWNQAAHYYVRTIKLYSQVNNLAGVAHTQENLGIIFLQQGDADKAIGVFSESLSFFKEKKNLHACLRLSILLGRAYLKQDEVQMAEDFLQQAEQLELQLGTSDQSTLLKLSLGELLIEKGSFQQAESLLLTGLDFSQKQNDKNNEINLLQALVKNAEKFKQWEKALFYQQQLTEKKIANYQSNFVESLAQKRAGFEYEQQLKEIKLLSKNNQIKQLELTNKKNQFFMVVLSLIIIIFIASFFILVLWKKRRQLKLALAKEMEFHHQQVLELGASYSSLKMAFGQFNQAIMVFNNNKKLIFSNDANNKLLALSQKDSQNILLPDLIALDNTEFWLLWDSEEEIDHRHLENIVLTVNHSKLQFDLIVTTIHREETLALIVLCDKQEKALNLPLSAILPQATFHQLLVDLMLLSLQLWENSTHSTRIELAEKSGIWRVSIDEGRLRTRSLDRYLSIKHLPKKPRWREVIRTAHFVLAECDLATPDKKLLEQKLEVVTQHIRAEALI